MQFQQHQAFRVEKAGLDNLAAGVRRNLNGCLRLNGMAMEEFSNPIQISLIKARQIRILVE